VSALRAHPRLEEGSNLRGMGASRLRTARRWTRSGLANAAGPPPVKGRCRVGSRWRPSKSVNGPLGRLVGQPGLPRSSGRLC